MTKTAAPKNREILARELACDILNLSRNQLVVNLRFLDLAIGNIKLKEQDEATFCSDGRYIYYNPWFVLNLYMSDQKIIARNMLHSILHCVFRHNFIGADINKYLWDLSCDIAVENSINDINIDMLAARRQEQQAEFINNLHDNLDILTAERIYNFLDKQDLPHAEIQNIRSLYAGDDHSIWYATDSDGAAQVQANIDLDQLWREISERMETELEVINGDNGALTQNLRDINRVRYNYTEFLKNFGIHGETMKISQEDFDYNYYSYGMDLYGDTPLIEPLEYQDKNKIKDLVIAIDTSGSVKGDVVQKFIQHTHDILHNEDVFHDKFNLYLIQCDYKVRESKLITSGEEFDKYLASMEIRGLSETDFRPVFAHVNNLVNKGELKQLRGLIYFTDGKGQFPALRPDYDVAFIINDDYFSDVWVPEWASKLYLSEDEIMDERLGA